MRKLGVLIGIGALALLAACSGRPLPLAAVVITSPQAGAEVVTGTVTYD